jgi:hypothetical protein
MSGLHSLTPSPSFATFFEKEISGGPRKQEQQLDGAGSCLPTSDGTTSEGGAVNRGCII